MALYLKVFRPLFVLSFLYLLGDAFFRWDGFSYYASFSEFLPSIALISILWFITAFLASIFIYCLLQVVKSLLLLIKRDITIEQLTIFLYIFLLLGSTVLGVKLLLLKSLEMTLRLQAILVFFMTFLSIIAAWKFRGQSKDLTGIVEDRIKPLIWLFGIWIILSVPFLIYHSWLNQEDKTSVQETSRSHIPLKNQPNIILVTFDAMTAMDMSVYGYHRDTTPFMKRWAKSAFLFTKVESESNFTTPATASLMTGKRLWTHQTYHILGSKPVDSSIENLPLVLKQHGYTTMAFIVNPVTSVRALGISDSFDIAPLVSEFQKPDSFFNKGEVVEFGKIDKILYRLFGDKIRLYDWIIKNNFILRRIVDVFPRDFSETTVPPEEAFHRFLLERKNSNAYPYFAWIHVLPPHAYYLPPKPFRGMFDSSSDVRSRGRYDEFIRYCDKQFEKFIENLTKGDKLGNTIIILSADHGESFEHNYLGHGGEHLYEQVTHIPLIVKKPGQFAGRIIDDLIEQIDIPATILDLAHISVPSWMEGRSLAPLMRSNEFPSRPAYSMSFGKNRSRDHQITHGTIAVWDGDYKLIHYLETNRSLLYNLKKDPDELTNLFQKESDVGQRLLSLIQDNLKKINAKRKPASY